MRAVLVSAFVLGGVAHAQSSPESPLSAIAHSLDIHGFVSQGAYVSTSNNYFGHSSRGSVEFFEAGLNVSSEVADRLRVGVQIFTRDLGPIGDYTMRLDWAFLDYRFAEWLGVRAGRIKMPFGLYNEYSDIDAARTSILLPQSIYSASNRDFLLAQTGFSLYGSPDLGGAGALDYQVYLGTIYIDPGRDPQVTGVDTEYVAGGQIFWRTPIAGLRAGASVLLSTLHIDFKLDDATVNQLKMSGAVPATFDGKVQLGLENANLWVGSIEYSAERLTLSAEYSRWRWRNTSTVPAVQADHDTDSERFYGMATYRATDRLELGAYYSFYFVDAGNRGGAAPEFARPGLGYQNDLALSLRYDLTDHWLLKAEGHYIHGIADLSATDNPDPAATRDDWGLFLAKTTVAF